MDATPLALPASASADYIGWLADYPIVRIVFNALR